MKSYIFTTTIVCSVEVEAESEAEAYEKVGEIDPAGGYANQSYNEWELDSVE